MVDTWTSKKDEVHDFGAKLEAGKSYVMIEEGAPTGYAFTNTVDIEITKDGKVNVTSDDLVYNETTKTYDLIDEAINISISKVDIADGEELEGATIVVYEADEHGKIAKDENGKEIIVETWISDKTEHQIGDKLEAGKSYIMRETVAPDGYEVTTDIGFSVDKDGTVTRGETDVTGGVILIEDTHKAIKISKVDVADGEELEGATIVIYELDEEGNVVKNEDGTDKVIDSWTSGKAPHEVTNIKNGKIYQLVETVAPAGYELTTATTFAIDEKGEIDKTKSTTTVSDAGVLLVEDTHKPIKISKIDLGNGEELAGATIVITDSNGNIVDRWISGKTPHIVTNIKNGGTYTLTETVAPNGYTIATATTFVIDENGEIDKTKTTSKVSEAGILLVEDARLNVSISKLRMNNGKILTDKFVIGAKLSIRVGGAEGAIAKDSVTGEQAMWTTEEASKTFVLAPGDYTLVEDAKPTGLMGHYYEMAAPIPFSITEDGRVLDEDKTTISDGMIRMYDNFDLSHYDEEVTNANRTGVDVTETPTEKRTTTNKVMSGAKRTTTPSTTRSTTTTNTTTTTTTKTSTVKTGDDQNAAIPAVAGLLAILAAGYILLEDRKRRKMR